jgi:hypothetical protein
MPLPHIDLYRAMSRLEGDECTLGLILDTVEFLNLILRMHLTADGKEGLRCAPVAHAATRHLDGPKGDARQMESAVQ